MVPATRQLTSEAVLTHILDNVFVLPQDHPIRLCFSQQSIESVDDLFGILAEDVDTLTYSPTPAEASDDVPVSMNLGHCRLLRHFIQWQTLLEKQHGNTLDNSDLMALTNQDFVCYRRSAIDKASSNIVVPPLVPVPIGNVPKPRSAAEEFQRGIKRDKAHYPVLKDDRYWDNFYRSFVVTAVSHNVEKVLDPSYVPTNPADSSLFEEQKKFVYSALEHTLQTDMGKNLVREHSFDFDAQEVFRKVVKHYTESASARIGSSTTLGYLTTAKYGSSWTGTAEGFILHWKNHLRIYNNTVPTDEQLPKQLCLSLLENAVHDVPELRQVKITATLDLAKGGAPISYKGYLSLLLASASIYNKGNNLTNSRGTKSKCSIYSTDLQYNLVDFDDDNGLDYDIDLSPATIYDANVHSRNGTTQSRRRTSNTPRERPYIPREMWNQLADDAKAILQGLAAPSKNPDSTGPSSTHGLQVNTHAQATDSTTHSDPLSSVHDTFHDCAPETELLAHLTDRVGCMNHGNIRKILAASRDPSSHDPEPKAFSSHVLQYQVSWHSIKNTTAALVDRGANGGLAGSDVKVLFKTGRSANITGINDHTLSNLDIVTAAGLVESQHGPIILILHQYACLGRGKTIHSSAQLEHYHNKVEDCSRVVGGQQRTVTLEDYIIPLHIRQGLPYMDMRQPTDKEFESLPHIILTSDSDWDP